MWNKANKRELKLKFLKMDFFSLIYGEDESDDILKIKGKLL